MNKRVIMYFLLTATLAIIFGSIYLTKEPFAVNSSGGTNSFNGVQTVLTNKSWMLTFSESIKQESIKEESIYIKDKNGDFVEVKLDIQNNSIKVSAPENGYLVENGPYELHIDGDIESVDGETLNGKKKITFMVHETLPTIGSKEELNTLFSSRLEQWKKEQKASDGSIFGFGRDSAASDEKAESSSADMANEEESGGGGGDFSDTNVQVQGVDEADIVKTDGEYIYQVIDQKLKITKAEPTKEMKVMTEVAYRAFNPIQLFLDGDQLVVIGNHWNEKAYNQSKETSTTDMILPVYESTRAIIYNISDRKNPVVEKTITLEGYYISSRKIDNHVYLLTNQYANYWILEEHPEADLRPRYSESVGEDEEKMEPVPFDKISYFPDSSEDNFMTIAAFDLEKPEEEASILTYVGSGNQIYMSKDNLYVAVPNHYHGPNWMDNQNTELYRFSVEGTNVQFAANGSIQGYLLNQFSMDEHKGYFRVAATRGQAWDEQSPSSNHLYILDGGLNTVSSVDDLARGERIYSVRFMQDKAYVVTFKEVDPLFVFDLSNPNEPKVLGELKIPGFSNYLHPYDENHLIGFGYDTKLEKDQWGTRVVTNGVKISLFDVSDPTNPLEKHTEIIGGRSTHSPLNYDHKALLFHKEKDIFAFPITMYHENEKDESYRLEFEGALVYGIDPEKGFTLHKQITHQKEDELYEQWEQMVQRILYIDDHLYTVTPQEIKATKITW